MTEPLLPPLIEISKKHATSFGSATDLEEGAPPKNRRVLGVYAVASLAFLQVCGSPYGSEGIVAAAGPLLTLVGCVVWPLLVSVPLALVTSELTTAFPENGGYTLWVDKAFGKFGAFQFTYWVYVGNTIDLAVYPVIAMNVVCTAFSGFNDLVASNPAYGLLVQIPIAWGAAWALNWHGQELTGTGQMIFFLLAMCPFVLFVAAALPHQTPAFWGGGCDSVGGCDWLGLANLLYCTAILCVVPELECT
jgi:amino acid transporter